MESATFRKWLSDRGCRIERLPTTKAKKEGITHVLVRRGEREAELPLAGSRKRLPLAVVHEIVDRLGLDRSELPEVKSRV
jgi:hypothetical protein